MGEKLFNFIVGIPVFFQKLSDFFAGKTGYLAVLGVLFVLMAIGTHFVFRDEYKKDKSAGTAEGIMCEGIMLVIEFLICAVFAKVIAFVLTLFFILLYTFGAIGLFIAGVFIVWGISSMALCFPQIW